MRLWRDRLLYHISFTNHFPDQPAVQCRHVVVNSFYLCGGCLGWLSCRLHVAYRIA